MPWFMTVVFEGLLAGVAGVRIADSLDELRKTDPDPLPGPTFKGSDVVVISFVTPFVVFMTDEKGSERTVEKGRDVVIPVPALKGPDPSLI